MIYASYHSRLEISFCMDEFLKPPMKDDMDFDDEIPVPQVKNSQKAVKEAEEDTDGTQRENNQNGVVAPSGNDSKESQESDNYTKERNGQSGSSVSLSESGSKNNMTEEVSEPDKSFSYTKLNDLSECAEEILDSTVLTTGSQNVCDKTENSKTVDHDRVVFSIGETEVAEDGTDMKEVSATKKVDRTERTSSFINISVDSGSDINVVDSIASVDELDQSVFEVVTENVKHLNTVNLDVTETSYTSLTSETVVKDTEKLSPHDNNRLAQLTPNGHKRNRSDEEVENPALRRRHISGSAQSTPEMRKKRTSGDLRDRSPNTPRRSTMTQLTDNSDPLNNYQINKDESIFQSSMDFQEQLVTHRYY